MPIKPLPSNNVYYNNKACMKKIVLIALVLCYLVGCSVSYM
jgi:hypothetical protein